MTLPREHKTDIINVVDGVDLIGDEETFFSIVSDFIELTAVLLEDVDQALDTADYELIRFKAHNLKGSSGNLSIHRLYNVGAELEKAVREQQLSMIPSLVAEAHREFASLKAHIREKNYPIDL